MYKIFILLTLLPFFGVQTSSFLEAESIICPIKKYRIRVGLDRNVRHFRESVNAPISCLLPGNLAFNDLATRALKF